jgi:phasin family protein
MAETAAARAQTVDQVGERLGPAAAHSHETRAAVWDGGGLVAVTRDQLAVVTASTRVLCEGAGQLNQQWFEFLQGLLRDGADAGRALAGCRSIEEMVEVQAEYGRSTLDRCAAEASKLIDLSVQLMREGLQSLQVRAEQVSEELPQRTRA